MPPRGRATTKGWLRPRAARSPVLPNWHGLLTPVVAHAFDDLGISVALWIRGASWYPIHGVRSIADFEYEHGIASRRWAYNAASFERAKRTAQPVRSEHFGFHDLFVPVRDIAGKVRGIFVAGPFAIRRPSSFEILERWKEITGTHGRLADPSFAHYVSMTLATLTLEGSAATTFERLMSCFADLVSARGDSRALAREAEGLTAKLQAARAAESMWNAARSMIDERTTRTWPTHAHEELARLGMKQAPQHVAVGLLLDRQKEPDPLDALLRRDAFQRASIELARKYGNTVCGQVGDHGVMFLVDYDRPRASVRSKLSDLASRAAVVARRFDLELHAGTSDAADEVALPARYRAALWAAEKALAQRRSIVYGEPRARRGVEHMRELRSQLGRSVTERAHLLSPRFDAYTEAVLAHSGYRLDSARAQLEAGLERLMEPLLAGGLLDPKSWNDLHGAVEQSSNDARTMMDLVSAYRRLVSDVEGALKSPTRGRQERGLRLAVSFIREHLAEPLNLIQVARIAGFARDYFSKIFQRGEGVTFGHRLNELRLARAKHVLVTTTLSIEQVQKVCGFQTRTHFHRAFKKAVGMTPGGYRERRPRA